MKEKITMKCQDMNEKFSEKFPKVSTKTNKCFVYIKDVWEETFPNELSITKQRLQRRKEIA